MTAAGRWSGGVTPAGPHRKLRGLRLRSGVPLRVLDASVDGVMVQSSARLIPGTSVELVLPGSGGDTILRAAVTRCEVAVIDPAAGIQYRAHLESGPRTNYSLVPRPADSGNELPTAQESGGPHSSRAEEYT